MLDLIEVTLSLDTAIYADGDVLAATQEVTGVWRANYNTGLLRSIVLLDKDDQGVALDLVFLRSNVALGTENNAPNISDTNASEVLGIVNIATGDYVDLGGARVATKLLAAPLALESTTTSLWIAAITRGGTPTYSAAGIVVKLGIERAR